MLSFKEHKELEQSIIEMLVIMESGDNLTEGLLDNVANKLGFKIHKSKGIIKHLANASKGLSKMIVAAIKGDREKVKEIAKTVKKKDVMDFLLKLDMATLHMITGPIHLINAITGWDLEVDMNHKSSTDTIKGLISQIKDKITKVLEPKKVSQYTGYLNKIHKELS